MISTITTLTPVPIYVASPETTQDEFDDIDPFSHIIRIKSPEDIRLHCQFVICGDCPYNQHNTDTSPAGCRPIIIKDATDECPELFV